LKDFYTHQMHSWEQLREAVDELSQNRLQLESDADAKPAFGRMEEILVAQSPYRMLSEVADLTHKVRGVNDKLVSDARGPAMAEIQGLLKGVAAELAKQPSDETLKHTITRQLESLLETATTDTSIAHIAQARHTGEAAFDVALKTIEEHREKSEGGGSGTGGPAPKKRRIVEARTCWTGSFIETPEEMEEFLNKLRAELEAAIKANERVQIK
jgi:hypothetical protein